MAQQSASSRCGISTAPVAAAICYSMCWSTVTPWRQIKNFLAERQLLFFGFELPPATLAAVQKRYPAAAALTDLDCWHDFETANPEAFLGMYIFHVGARA